MTVSSFEADHAEDMQDSEYAKVFARESAVIATVDDVINGLDDIRMNQGMTKSELARLIDVKPASVRHLFTIGRNPTLKALAALAHALGYRIVLEPLDASRPSGPPQGRGSTGERPWEITVLVPSDLSEGMRDDLFARIADVVHDWESERRDGWDASITAGVQR